MDPNKLMIELERIEKEILRHKSEIKRFNNRKNEINQEILSYLDATGEDSFKYKDKIFEKIEKVKRTRKKKSEKEEECKAILSEITHETDETYNQIIKSLKGTERIEVSLVQRKRRN